MNVLTGIWRAMLDPVEAGGPYIVAVFTKNSTATLKDVLFGDVWLCGGQSNMYFTLAEVERANRTPACLSDEHFPINMNVQQTSV